MEVPTELGRRHRDTLSLAVNPIPGAVTAGRELETQSFSQRSQGFKPRMGCPHL